jgi:rare lipoprotein A (peptidoglycan hydrolase)
VNVGNCTTPGKTRALRLLAVATLVATLLVGGGLPSGLPQAAAATKAQHRAAKAARLHRQRAKAQAARIARRAKLAARRARARAKLAAQRKRAKARAAAKKRAKATARRTAAVRRKAAPTGWRTARASWYGPGFYGHTMAGGGNLRRTSMILAHKTLPFGTLVEVSVNGTSVVAPVRDRGPYVRGREFDLGPGVRKALGVWGVFTIRYRIVG